MAGVHAPSPWYSHGRRLIRHPSPGIHTLGGRRSTHTAIGSIRSRDPLRTRPGRQGFNRPAANFDVGRDGRMAKRTPGKRVPLRGSGFKSQSRRHRCFDSAIDRAFCSSPWMPSEEGCKRSRLEFVRGDGTRFVVEMNACVPVHGETDPHCFDAVIRSVYSHARRPNGIVGCLIVRIGIVPVEMNPPTSIFHANPTMSYRTGPPTRSNDDDHRFIEIDRIQRLCCIFVRSKQIDLALSVRFLRK